MNQRKQIDFKSKYIFIPALAILSIVSSLFAVPTPVQAAGDCSDVYTPLSSFVTNGVNNNRSFYDQVMNETGVPWEMLAAIHYRETNFSHTNPSNGQGIFQFVNGDGGPYPAGPVSDGEFVRQLRFMANRLQSDYVWRGSVPRERRQLQANEQNITIVKDTLYSYNGRASAYANQASQYGYSSSAQPYEGSPYVMNRFDCQRARMGIITTDGGGMNSTDTRYGAFTVFARLRGDAYWQSMWTPYDWSIESYTYSGGDNLIAGGQTETVTLRVRNTGSLPWYNHGNHPVRLGTWSPANRASPLASPGWLANNRPTTLQENSVAPGAVGTFTFQITPGSQGTYVEAFNLVAENSQWMRWPGFSPTIVVTDGYQWRLDEVIYGDGTGLMNPGSTQLITVKARNTGNVTWNKFGPNPVRIGTWQPQRQSAVVASDWRSSVRAVDMNENTVAPGQVAGFQFNVRAPSVGNFYERFNLVAENRSWLNDEGLTLYLRGGGYAWQPVWYSHSTGTINIPRNTNFTLTIKARNTGDFTWRKTSGFPPVRLGTTAPLDRGSAFYTPSWIRDTRPSAVVEDTVAPGQEGTFTFTARTPNSPGMWNERFVPVAEGVMWLNDTGFSIPVNVQ